MKFKAISTVLLVICIVSIMGCIYLYLDQATTAARWQTKALAQYGQDVSAGQQVTQETWWTTNPIWLGFTCWLQDAYSWVLAAIGFITKFIFRRIRESERSIRMFEKLLQKLMAWYYGSPLAKSMVQGMLTDLKEQGERILPIVESAIKTAALSDTMSGKEKLASVVDAVAVQAPAVERSLITATVTSAFRVLQKDPNVPEVQ